MNVFSPPLATSFGHPYSVVVVHTLLTYQVDSWQRNLVDRDIAQLGLIHRVHIVQ